MVDGSEFMDDDGIVSLLMDELVITCGKCGIRNEDVYIEYDPDYNA